MTQAKPLPAVQKRLQYVLVAAYLYCALAGLWAPILSDEAFSLSTSVLPVGPLLEALKRDVHPPLYYLLLHVWFAVVPESVEALRVVSGLGLAAAGWLFYRFLQTAGEEEAALAGAVLFIANPLMILLAGYGRMYTWLAAVCAAALWAAWAQVRGSRAAGLALAALTCVGLLTHNWFVFFLTGLGGAMLAAVGWRALRLLPAVAGGGCLYFALWGDAALRQIGATGEQLAWLKRPGWTALPETLAAHLWLAAAAAPVFLVWVALRGVERRSLGLWMAAAIGVVGALAAPWLVSQWKPLYNPRFTVVAAPFLAWALSGAVARVGRVAVPVLAAAACLWATVDAARVPACNSRAAAEILSQKTKAEDTVVFCRLSRQPVEWYWRGGAARRVSFPAGIDQHPGYEGTLSEAEARAEARRIVAQATGRIFVVADTASAASRILLAELEGGSFRELEPACLACESAGKHYFNRLVIFERQAAR